MPTTLKERARQRYSKAEQVFRVPSWADASLVDQWIFMAWMGLLAFGVMSFGAVEPWSLATLEMGSALLWFGWLLAGMHRGNLHVQLLPIFIPALLFGGLILLQIILRTTAYEFETRNMAYRFIAIGLLMFVGAQVLNSEARFRTFGFAVTLFGAGVALLAILQGMTSPNQIYWTVIPRFGDGVFGPYVNHSHYAGLMEMLLPFPFLLANCRAIPEGRRGLGYVVGAVMAGSVFVSGSRGGVVAASVQLCLIYFLLRKQMFAESSSRQKNGKWLNTAAILVVAGVVLWLGGQEMITRISSIKDPFGNTVGATRLLIFKDTMRMIAQRPVMGWGAGAFQTVYPAFRSFPTDVVVNAAHNDYLQLLVEFGMAGAFITAIFLFLTYRHLNEHSQNWRNSWPSLVSFGTSLGTVGILVHSLTDFNLQIPANAAIFYVFCMIASLPASTVGLKLRDDVSEFGLSSIRGPSRRTER